jgi:hypothetical protein
MDPGAWFTVVLRPVSDRLVWQSISIRDNIIFGQPYDEQKYQDIVQHVCLQPDFDMLP